MKNRMSNLVSFVSFRILKPVLGWVIENKSWSLICKPNLPVTLHIIFDPIGFKAQFLLFYIR